ncbi:phosphatase PAP2 family protein [Motilibacter aurantiacus]|uniref:phosphatase PAP2 family protein n=1 Tax=Motilibacter aurantiacus TaxID=2714955 RepID=UPI00140C4D7B|nr:phosphatase PAP2 family protein [Motilibacter aurantiacus]NHC46581.1 phosphatase PAP2 family protein [Motilibacter aurantiacus]
MQPAPPSGPSAPSGPIRPTGSPGRARAGRRDLRALLGLAAGCFAAVLGVWAFFGRTRRGMMADSYGVGGAASFKARFADQLSVPLDAVSVPSLLVAAALLAAVGLARRRPWLAAAAVAVQLGGPVLTAGLKQLLARDVDSGWVHTLPSGHTTVATASALAAVLLTAERWRAAVAGLGACFAVAVGVASVGIQAHMPSDVAAAYASTLGWGLLVVAALAAYAPQELPERAAGARLYRQVLVLGSLAALLGAFGLLVLARLVAAPPRVVGDLFDIAFAGAACGVAAGALAVLALWLGVVGRVRSRRDGGREHRSQQS